MDLPVAVRMQQHPILGTIRSTARAPDDVVIMPSRQGRDGLPADWATPLLGSPEVKRLPVAPELGRHLYAQAGRKVALPGRIIGIGLPSDFHMPPN